MVIDNQHSNHAPCCLSCSNTFPLDSVGVVPRADPGVYAFPMGRWRESTPFRDPLERVLQLIRNLYLHSCTSVRSGSNEPAPPKLLSSLPHRGQSHATAIDGRQANPVVNDLNAHLLSTSEANHTGVRMCMACHIGQCFLHHTIAGH